MNNKGIIFALDGAIAVTVVLIMLINTTYYFTTTSKESLSQTQIVKRGYDALAMFDYFELLDNTMRTIAPGTSFVPESAPNGINVTNYLPLGYDMMVVLEDARKTACSGCTINSANPIIGPYNLASLQKGSSLYIQVNAELKNQTTSKPTFSVRYNNTDYGITGTCLSGDCTYTTIVPLPGLVVGPSNQISFVRDSANDFEITWFRVLDDPGYTLTTDRTLPTDRFIGSGERWYASFDANGHFDALHKSRFLIWLV